MGYPGILLDLQCTYCILTISGLYPFQIDLIPFPGFISFKEMSFRIGLGSPKERAPPSEIFIVFWMFGLMVDDWKKLPCFTFL